MAKALIAGALGVIGRALVEHLDDDPDWEVVGLSRRAPDFETGATFLSVDLLDRAATQSTLGDISDVTHIFFTPYAPRETFAAEVAPNLAMLVNLMDAVEPAAKDLAHVQLMQGAKWYGVQFGKPYKTPAREDDPRHMTPNFYYDQQDWLVERQNGKDWTWSALRPHGVWGFSVGSAMNMMTSLAVYATVSKHLGLPLRWPGNPALLDSVYQIVDVALLARAMVWAATAPGAANRPFNITNGDYTRWKLLWPKLAAFFDMEVGPIQSVKTEAIMADKEPVWAEITEQHLLRKYAMSDIVTWPFLDYAFANGFDQMSSLTSIRQAGWTEVLDTEETVTDQLQRLRDNRIIP
ncbi:MAG: SDR family oxidoreductase [Alphaproteobacteria bacterium]